MALDVAIDDVGPCKKHVRVKVPRTEIERYHGQAVNELITTASVPGFRPGKVPRKLVERRYRNELEDQVKQKVLLDSLEQLDQEHNLDPINEPQLDVESIEIPEEGDFEYEFDVEVRPEFELPSYAGLKIQREIRDVTDEDVDAYLKKFLAQYGQRVPHDGAAEKDDFITATVELEHDGKPLRRINDLTVQIKPVLRFHDADLEGFDELMVGVQPDETRETDVVISEEASDVEMRRETVHVRFSVHDVKRMRLPEMNKELLDRIGVESEQELRDEIREMLERQITYQQRQSARQQVLDKITESADWDLPEGLVSRQVENALYREILEMQQAGFTEPEIRARENELRQHAISNTRQALKEHFVLDKIAEQENIEVTPSDIDTEIQLMAMQRGESPRRVRARLSKQGLIENLEAQIRERKAVDVILDQAEYENVEAAPPVEDRIEAVGQAICREPQEPAAGGEPAENAGE